MRKTLRVALGVTTSVGGFLDAGALATAAAAGAQFRFALLWALIAGTICSIVLMEMAGRIAIVSGHALRDAMHERFGVTLSIPVLAIGLVVDVLILASEIGGASVALQLGSGISFQWWAIPVGLLAWLLIWTRSFSFIERAVSFAGLTMYCPASCPIGHSDSRAPGQQNRDRSRLPTVAARTVVPVPIRVLSLGPWLGSGTGGIVTVGSRRRAP